MIEITENISLNKSEMRAAVNDIEQSARAVNLIYVGEDKLCIRRAGGTKSFYYLEGEKKIEDENIISRIRKLVLPPAWKEVKICKLENGHLQATGLDALNRKQYRYHTLWSTIRNHTKFYRMLEFGKQLPAIRIKLEKDLSLKGYPRKKVLAAIVTLLQLTSIRVGNASYEKLYGSFGLTTLKNRHVALDGTKLVFSFKGKKGIQHRITLKSKKLSRIVKDCKDIPGKDLFEYIDDEGSIHNIDSGMVNDYIGELSGGDFTAKDFRTWAGSVQAILAFNEAGKFENDTQMKQKINAAFENVAHHLGNTKAVCKKYYVHPSIAKLYEENKLGHYLANLKTATAENGTGLTTEEKILMKILEHS